MVVTTAAGYVDQNDRYGSLLLDLLEYVPDLTWPLSVQTYAKMRRDSQLAGVLAGYTLPLRRATWLLDPSGADPKVVRHIADDLGLPVMGDDQPGKYRRRGVSWAQHIRVAMLHLVFGHMPFAHGFEYRKSDRLLHLVALSERMPQTVSEIDVDSDTGALVGIRQYSVAKDLGQPKLIKAEDLTWYAHDREGSAWHGTSLLRPAYAPWLLKREMLRVHATSNRRNGSGTPTARWLPGTNPSPEQYAAAQKMAQAARVGETAGATMPPGAVLEYIGVSGTLPDTLDFIRYLDQQMSRMALAGVLDLGDTPNGSRALGTEFVDLLMLSLQAVGDTVAATATADTVQRIVDTNYGEDVAVPQVVCTDIGEDRAITTEALVMLLDSGALSGDPELEAYLRRKYGLPERSTTAPPPLSVAPPVAAGRHARRTRKPAAASGLRRQPTVVEAAAETNFETVAAQWDGALDQLVADWDEVSTNQREQLLEQVRAAVVAGDVEALTGLQADSATGAELLAATMVAVAQDAAVEQSREAGAQGVAVDAGEPDEDRLTEVAATLAALTAGGLAASAARKTLQVWTPAATAGEVVGLVAEHLAGLTDTALRDNLGAGLSTAQNEGRLATLRQAATADVYAASEILDGNTCDACRDVDGHRFDTLAEAESAYANGGYTECQGLLRCRGIIVTVWDAARLQDAA